MIDNDYSEGGKEAGCSIKQDGLGLPEELTFELRLEGGGGRHT